MAAADQIKKFRGDLTKKLHEPNPVTNVLAKVEQKTGVDRFFIVCGFAGICSLYMIFGYFAELVANVVGMLYPAYMSIKAIESVDKKDDTQWLTYWVIFAIFSVIEFASDCIVGWFPLYWLVKCAVLLYLHLPFTLGAQKLYDQVIRPFVLRHQKTIDETLGHVTEKLGDGLKMAGGGDHTKVN